MLHAPQISCDCFQRRPPRILTAHPTVRSVWQTTFAPCSSIAGASVSASQCVGSCCILRYLQPFLFRFASWMRKCKKRRENWSRWIWVFGQDRVYIVKRLPQCPRIFYRITRLPPWFLLLTSCFLMRHDY